MIQPVVNVNEPNATERMLLEVAFGRPLNYGNISKLAPQMFTHFLSQARARLNRQLRKVLPSSAELTFDVQPIDGKREELGFSITDGHGGHTPFGQRGAGVRHLISAMAVLMNIDFKAGHVIILFDEPESSLHSDAHHWLR